MPENSIFFLLFLSQIFLLSFYFPRKILARANYVLTTYPEEEYPKLYPRSIQFYKKSIHRFKILNIVILTVGLIAFFILANQRLHELWQFIITVYFFLQYIPMLILEISSFKYYEHMRELNPVSTRKAVLEPRKLFNYISPMHFGATVLMYMLFVFYVLSLNHYEFYIGSKAFQNIIIISTMHLFFAGIILWNLRGKKLDPHQSSEDRNKQIGFTIRSLTTLSIVATAYFIINSLLKEYQIEIHKAAVLSFYFQGITFVSIGGMFKAICIESIDFSVYKANPS